MSDKKLCKFILGVLGGTISRRGEVKTGPLSTPELVVEAIARRELDPKLPRQRHLELVRNACSKLELKRLIESSRDRNNRARLLWTFVKSS